MSNDALGLWLQLQLQFQLSLCLRLGLGESVKNMQLKEQKDRLFKVIKTRNNQSFNNVNNKLSTDD